jgi:hypothetical protein
VHAPTSFFVGSIVLRFLGTHDGIVIDFVHMDKENEQFFAAQSRPQGGRASKVPLRCSGQKLSDPTRSIST